MTDTLAIEREETFTPQKTISLKSDWVHSGEMRLDASYYVQDFQTAMRVIDGCGYAPILLGNLTETMFYPPRAKRFIVEKGKGKPYLTASEMVNLLFQPKYILTTKIRDPDSWYVKGGWLLVTRSGTVGIPFLATNYFKDVLFSEHLIRVVPKDSVIQYSGFLYAYLSTWIAYAILSKDTFGGVVDEIEPSHLQNVPVPDLPDKTKTIIHLNMVKAVSMRDKARELLHKAEESLNKELELENVEYEEPKMAVIKSSDIDMRFDASFHVSDIKNVIGRKAKKGSQILRLGNPSLTKKIFIPPRFKRIYVDREYGIPFLQGTHVSEVKPYGLKYISKKTKHLEKWMVKAGWILVTCSGTLGRVSIVPTEWDNWAVSQHALRIVPNTENLHPGYLAAFLMSRWGYEQVISKTHGGVVDELGEDDMKKISILLPVSYSGQERIGKLVEEAFDLREKANFIENETIRTLEEMLLKHKRSSKTALKEIEHYYETFDRIGNNERK